MDTFGIVAVSVIFGGGFLTLFMIISLNRITEFWKHYRMVRLKTKMVENGYSADDIIRVTGLSVGNLPDRTHNQKSSSKIEYNTPKPPVKTYGGD